LTPQELNILRLAKDGASTSEIARKVHLAYGTVRNYLSNLVAKLDVKTKAEAIQMAQENDWL
jgi:two-component system response regulator DesR